MKIIADMSTDIRLVSVSIRELAIIQGYDNQYSTGFLRSSATIGAEIDIEKFKRISDYVRTMNATQLKTILSGLQDAQKDLIDAIALADELQVFDTLKE